MTTHNSYVSPLASRYASAEMSALFSAQFKHCTWRKLWVALAKAQKKLGLGISDKQIKAMEAQVDAIDFDKAHAYEQKFHHDVMAHIHTFGDACPEAKGVIHLGATSCYVTDNTELLQMREGLKLLRGKLIHVIRHLSAFAAEHAHLPCLSYTHLQPAQPTTVGKRTCLWIQDFITDLKDLDDRLEDFTFLGVKGATGTQASFLALFDNDRHKVQKLEALVAKEMGFTHVTPISGQTYSRKQDVRIIAVLQGLAVSSHKCATDIRLLAHLKEIEEPFAEKQVGSSAMPYKRNPVHSERVCGLARFLISLGENPSYTAATQWLERSLDDSANRRLAIPEAFLTADAILTLLISITSKLVIYPKMIAKHLDEELPFMATENILMASVSKGKDRQELHEKLRQHSLAASHAIKAEGKEGELLSRLAKDPAFGLSKEEIHKLAQVDNFVGLAAHQTIEFLRNTVEPCLLSQK